MRSLALITAALVLIYSADVRVSMPPAANRGRPRVRPIPSESPRSAQTFIDKHAAFRRVGWRTASKGRLTGDLAIVRVRPADGPEDKDGLHLPGDPAWLVTENKSAA